MFTATRFWLLIFASMVIAGMFWTQSPYNTALPMELDRIPAIQPQLDKLPEQDRNLVLDYLKRSNGDVLPAAFADPDEPFTARTFRQAIALQKDFLVLQSKRDATASALQADREARLAPLRKVLALQMLRRQLLTEQELYPAADTTASYGAKAASVAGEGSRFLVVTYRLQNLSARAVTASQGVVSVRDVSTRDGQHEELAQCFIDHTERLDAGSSAEIRCGQPNKPASRSETAFTTMPVGAFTVEWEPRAVTFADGTQMTSGL